MAEPLERGGALEKLEALVNAIRIATLTTIGLDGSLHGRPLLLQQYEPEGVLWFLIAADSDKAVEVQADGRVQISLSNTHENSYVCGSATAEVVDDRRKIAALWNPQYASIFPDGPNDPNVTLLRVRLLRAEFWDAPRMANAWVAGIVAMSPESPPDSHGIVSFA